MKLTFFLLFFVFVGCFASNDGTNNNDSSNKNHLADKLNCVAKLFPLTIESVNASTRYEAVFNNVCHNFIESYNCFAKFNYTDAAPSTTLEGVIDHIYTCGLPFSKALNSLCSIGYKRANQTRKCYDAAVENFSGSAMEAQCRKTCCHNAREFDPETPWRCSAGNDDIEYITRKCDEPVVDEKLRENACQISCMFESAARYAKSHCDMGISSVFQSFSKGMKTKYTQHEKCFEMCPLV
uniref:Chondroitin proteoglycan 4 domain-containing protein n=1 Tax=Panagrellus redivivus TaxID=6233 RepID=A0A7E4V405_PANRE